SKVIAQLLMKSMIHCTSAKPAQKPPKSCYTDAKKFRAVNYQRVDRMLSQMKGCLADGFPFVFGFTVYDSFESAEVPRTGVLQMPAPREGVIGGRAVLRLATTIRPSVSWCAVRGAQAGAKEAISRCPTRICSGKPFRRFLDDPPGSLIIGRVRGAVGYRRIVVARASVAGARVW